MTSPDSPDPLRRRMDAAFAIGRAVMGPSTGPARPEVPGYRVVAFAARGGLGEVWRAERGADGLPAALKLPHGDDPEVAERLALEAEVLRALRHPHIVELLGFTHSVEARPVLVMEWVDGPNLAARLPAGGFPLEEALRIFLPVVDAIGHAHRQGVIHRDLKPANILLTSEGVPKVSDFGLARSLRDRLVTFSLTQSGAVAGTVEYLAPECYLPGYEPSAAADLYALGVLLYELLTGTPPRGSWRRLSEVRPLDVRLDELMEDAIHPDPARRIKRADEFRRRLEEISGSRPRLSGTPLLTPAVRTLDVLWTVLGIYLCAASFCATLTQSSTPVPQVFDLSFGATRMMAGFFAVWVLSLGIGLMWLWQAVRLWIFRHVPLRESLPSPFGLRLGNTRLAAVLVAASQFLLALTPVLCTLLVVAVSLHFRTPETPVWQRSLVVTPWGTDEPVSPWKWDPLHALDGGAYWIKEAQGGITPGTLRVYDKTSFFILTQPFLMSLAAGITGGGLLLTFLMVCRQWLPRRWKTLTGLTLAALVTGVPAAALWHWEFTRPRRQIHTPSTARARTNEWAANESARQVAEAMDTLVLHRSAAPPDPKLLRTWFPKRCVWMNGTARSGAEIAEWAAADRAAAAAEQRIVEDDDRWMDLKTPDADWTRTFRIAHFVVEAFDSPAGGPPGYGTRLRRLEWKGQCRENRRIHVTGVKETVTPLYAGASAAPPLTGLDAERWLAGFLEALSAPGCQGLEDFFLPLLLAPRPNFLIRREHVTATLRGQRARWETLRFEPLRPSPPPVPRAAARWFFRPVLRPAGRAPGGAAPEILPDFAPSITLVRIDGSPRILGFSF